MPKLPPGGSNSVNLNDDPRFVGLFAETLLVRRHGVQWTSLTTGVKGYRGRSVGSAEGNEVILNALFISSNALSAIHIGGVSWVTARSNTEWCNSIYYEIFIMKLLWNTFVFEKLFVKINFVLQKMKNLNYLPDSCWGYNVYNKDCKTFYRLNILYFWIIF